MWPCKRIYLLDNCRCRVEGIRTSPLYVRPQISYRDGAGRLTVLIGEKMPNKVVDSITLVLPLPQAVTSAEMAANCGSVHYDAASKASAVFRILSQGNSGTSSLSMHIHALTIRPMTSARAVTSAAIVIAL